MGVSASSGKVEAAIKQLGTAYEQYAVVAVANGIDSKLLTEYASVKALFADLDLQPPKKLHEKRLDMLLKGSTDG
jgi:hypothetical protein